MTLISCMPVTKKKQTVAEGWFTQEGGGAQSFDERVATLQEMHKVINDCFEDNKSISLSKFRSITETKSSDMLLVMLGLFRERLPCSNNYWRFKRSYDSQVSQKASSVK